MLTWLIKRRLAAFEKAFDYDMSYAREITDADSRAMLAFARIQSMSEYKRDVPKDVYYAAKLAGTLAEDCGPCTQLAVTMALKDGVDGATLAAVVRGDEAAMPEAVRLGWKFARAAVAHDATADELREEITKRWGRRAPVALAFAVAAARVYPTVKYALGFGKACTRVVVSGQQVVPGVAARAS
jgi:hypothetical protein